MTSGGVVTAVANGSAWVVATESRGSMDSALVVVKQRVATVQVTPGTRNVYLTRTFTFSAAAVDGRGNPVAGSPVFTWASSAPAVASVDSTGRITGTGLGPVQISATTAGITGVANVTVLTPITRIEVGRNVAGAPVTDTTSLKSLGDTRNFVAVAHDTLDAVMTGVTFAWTSTNGSVAVLDSVAPATARATAAANGVTAITATAQGVSGSATLKVAQALASIELTPDTLRLGVNGSGGLTARGLDARGRFIAGGAYTFTALQPAIATVNATSGLATGVANGTGFAVATSGTVVSDTVVLLVGGTVPASISFGRDTLSVGRGSAISVPILLSKPNGAPVTVNLAVGDTAAYWSTASVVIPAGQTSVNATLNGHNAGTTFVAATDGSGTGFTGDTAALAVQATMRLTGGTYSVNQTDQVATQVLLSDPSPAGGTYVTFGFGTPNVATVSPDPAFIPAGQLAADIQLIGSGAGTTTITPQAIGVNGTASNFTSYAAKVTMYPSSSILGAGQVNQYAQVSIPTYANQAVSFTLSSSDSGIVRVPSVATVPANSYYTYFTISAAAPGTATIAALNTGWSLVAPISVKVSTPHVGICCATSLVTTSPATNVTVYSEDSLKSTHPRTSSLVVNLRSTDTTVMRVLDSMVTIPPGYAYNYSSAARIIPGGLGGSAYIISSASGHTPDSALVTVTGPKLSLSPALSILGAGQENSSVSVSMPNAISTPLTITIAGRDSNIVGTPGPIVIPVGGYYAYFTIRGKATGRDTIIASAPGYQPDTAIFVVSTPGLSLSGGGTLNNFGGRSTIGVYAVDSLGTGHTRTLPLTISLVSGDTNVVKVDSATVTMAAGASYVGTAGATPVGLGTTTVIATAPGHKPDTITYTVKTPKLSLGFSSITLGKRQTTGSSGAAVSTPDYRPSPLVVTFTHSNPAADTLTSPSVTIPTSGYYTYYGVYALAQGTDTIIASAPGYIPDTGVVRVTTPRLVAGSLPSSMTTTNPPVNVYVSATDSVGSSHYVSDTLTIRALSTDTTVIRPVQQFFRLPKGQANVYTAISVVGPGAAAIIFSDSAGTGYVADTTNTTTITGPALTFSTSSVVLGMRQRTDVNQVAVYTPNPVASPLIVSLASTDPRVATAPATVTIPAGASYGYFTISGLDTLGTIQLQATATGYSAASMSAQVTQPEFTVSTNTSTTTTGGRQVIWVYARDANGTVHPTTENVTVTLASSSSGVASIDSATVTILAGSSYNNHATWGPGVVGTAQLSASDTRAAFYKYNTGTANVAVTTPALNFNFGTLQLGVGQYVDNMSLNTTNALPAGGSVTLAHSAVPHTSTSPASPLTIAPNTSYTYFRVSGTSLGADTLTATLTNPAHTPGSAIVVVGQGRIDPISGWPGTLAVGDSALITIYARDPSQGVRNVLAATTWTLAPNANIEFRAGGAVITSATIPANAQYVSFYVKALSAGTASATFSAPNYANFTNAFTVNP